MVGAARMGVPSLPGARLASAASRARAEQPRARAPRDRASEERPWSVPGPPPRRHSRPEDAVRVRRCLARSAVDRLQIGQRAVDVLSALRLPVAGTAAAAERRLEGDVVAAPVD